MNFEEFRKMKDCEETLWWYRSLHRYLRRLIIAFNDEPNSPALDIGCGTGAWMAHMIDMNFKVSGIDIAAEAVRLCQADGIKTAIVGSANELPYDRESFQMVTSVDVLECDAVDPVKAISECIRVLKRGGIGVIVMAAHQWLLSEHDRAVHSVRRYNKQQLNDLLGSYPVDLLFSSYLFSALFPVMALLKKINPPRYDRPRDEAVSDVRLPHPVVNRMLDFVGHLESFLLPGISLPMGTSICTVFRKNDR